MWSLPDLKRLNEDAVKFNSTLNQVVITGKTEDGEPLVCEWAGHDGKCEGEVRAYEYYDIFSDVPKGYLALCERHDGYYGSPSEGYFECDGCQKIFVENYTWELYRHDDEGGTFCLNCYRENELADDENWLNLTDQNINALTFDRVRQAQHLIAVGQDTPAELTFIGNVELDGSTGGRLTGFSSCEDTPDGGVEELRDLLRKAKEQGYERAILILDAAYQFSISIGVYCPAKKAVAHA
jgi:predicted Fe-S protein YdhL (DUF1289 family)